MDTMIDQDTPLYNSRTIMSYMELLSRRYPHVDPEDILRFAGMQAKREKKAASVEQVSRTRPGII